MRKNVWNCNFLKVWSPDFIDFSPFLLMDWSWFESHVPKSMYD